ncbi:hypothetical protein HDV01_002532 [Terramyces sp. JEL0728]|nr:hypothetical protein HDV01_002532 [Terramyces sp. JEL0728]
MIYKKVRYSCDYCTKRKRKCDRQQPCSFCVAKSNKCEYSNQAEVEEQLEKIEQRIKQMERRLLVTTKYHLEKKEQVHPTIIHVTLSHELQKELFERDHEYLLELRFKKFPGIILGITEEYYRQSAKIFWPLRFALYSCGALFVKDHQLPPGISNRLDLVNLFLQKAQSFDYAKCCDHISVMTLEVITNVCYRNHFAYIELNSIDEAVMYFRLTIQYARISKISCEEQISKITLFDYEREHIRRIWWLVYRDYCSFPKHVPYGSILAEENKLFLPSSNIYFEFAGSRDYFGIEIMSSKEWYTYTLPDLDIEALHMIIQRIQEKTNHYFNIELTGNNNESHYIGGCINASMIDWMSVFTVKFQLAKFTITNQIEKDQDKAWFTIYISMVYFSARINLVLPAFMRNVIDGKKVTEQLYFKEALDAAVSCAQVVELIMKFNPDLKYMAMILVFALFPVGFFLLCCKKLLIDEATISFKIIIKGFQRFCHAFQKLNQFHNILLHMELLDLIDSVIYYGIFIGRQKGEIMERPAPSHIELMEYLLIK